MSEPGGDPPPTDETAPTDDGAVVTRVVMQGRSTPQGFEMLRVAARRLAKRHGVEITSFRIDREEDVDPRT